MEIANVEQNLVSIKQQVLSLIECKIKDSQCILTAMKNCCLDGVASSNDNRNILSSILSYFPTAEMNSQHVSITIKEIIQSYESVGLTSVQATELMKKILRTILSMDDQRLKDDADMAVFNNCVFTEIIDFVSLHTKYVIKPTTRGKIHVNTRGSSLIPTCDEATELAWYTDGSLWVNGKK